MKERLLLKNNDIRDAELLQQDILYERVWEDEKGFIYESEVQKVFVLSENPEHA